MGKQILIGKEGNQPFAIGDPKVSRRHAILAIEENGQLFLIDNNSTNGTYIYNGSAFVRIPPNHPYPVTPDAMIQLGTETRFHVRRLLPAATQPPQPPKQKPQPKRVDIKGLRHIAENYAERKMKLESKAGSVNSLRSCTILVSLVAAGGATLFSNFSDMDKNKAILASLVSLGIAIILMVVLLMLINRFNNRIIRERTANEKDYAVKYCCPECGVSFRGKMYENILAERQCPKCKTQYYDSDIKN